MERKLTKSDYIDFAKDATVQLIGVTIGAISPLGGIASVGLVGSLSLGASYLKLKMNSKESIPNYFKDIEHLIDVPKEDKIWIMSTLNNVLQDVSITKEQLLDDEYYIDNLTEEIVKKLDWPEVTSDNKSNFSKVLYVALKSIASAIREDSEYLEYLEKTIQGLRKDINKPSSPSHFFTITPSNQYLLSRENELDNLKKIIANGGGKSFLLNGMGGIGKSALAKKLFWNIEKDFMYAGWVNYRDNLRNSLLGSFRCPQGELISDEKQRFSFIMDFIHNPNNQILMVIDNFDYDILQDDTLGEICGLPNTCVVLTSRKTTIQGFQKYTIGFLPLESCKTLFYYYFNENEEVIEEEIVEELVKWSHYHTLTIQLLAKAASQEDSLKEYYEKLRASGFDAADVRVNTEHHFVSEGDTVSNHLRFLYNISELKKDAEIYRILWNFANMPSIEIPTSVRDWIGAKKDDLNKLVKYGWITKQYGSGYEMHPLISEIIRLDSDTMPADTYDCFFESVINNRYFCSNSAFSEKLLKLDIIDTVLSNINMEDTEKTADILDIVSAEYLNHGLYQKALVYYEKTLSIRKRVLDEDNPVLWSTYNNYGFICSMLGELTDSEKNYHDALEQLSKINNGNNSLFAKTSTNLGLLYYKKGMFDEAERCYENSLTIQESLCKSIYSDLAMNYYSYAKLCEMEGNVVDTEKYFLKAQELQKNGSSSNTKTPFTLIGCDENYYLDLLNQFKPYDNKFHFFSGIILTHLGILYREQQRFKESEKCFLESIDEQTLFLSIVKKELSVTYNNYGMLCVDKGMDDKAEEFYLKAIEIKEHYYEDGDIGMAETYDNIAALYNKIDQFEKAQKYSKKSIEIYENSYGEKHPDTAIAYHNYSSLLLRLGNVEGAEVFVRKAIAVNEELLGTEHINTALSYNTLANIHCYYNRYDSALELWEKALKIICKVYGPQHYYCSIIFKSVSSNYHKTTVSNNITLEEWVHSLFQ